MFASTNVTERLIKWSNGDQTALEELTPLVYNELHRLAAGYLRQERSDHTLQATALVHEAYLQIRQLDRIAWKNRAHFIAMAAQTMRRILVDHARKHGAQKRGGADVRIELGDLAGAGSQPDLNIVALDQALDRFSKDYPRQAQVVELRFFGGLTTEETVEVLNGTSMDVSSRTVERDWRFARAWLHNAIAGGLPDPPPSPPDVFKMADPRLEDLFLTALDLDGTERARFLDQQCHGDSALLSELRSLLESDAQAETARFWKKSALEAEAVRTALEPDARIGQRIGVYKIADVISSGGMGTVYRAVRDDAEYQKHVAVKVIKRGMDTDVLVRRFRSERQILAQLEHPNIARLLDGGTTTDGLPYLVMEYVDGQPIDQYVDARALSLPERLRLFRTVCSAVQYAHQNLVVHRDLKPNNILVTADGVPKLLDFGIAKILTPDQPPSGEHTMPAQAFLTPEYASPEQVRAESITTLSDVYSLGVLLYRLLTGRSPYRFKTRQPEEIAKTICFQDPDKPSAVLARLRGDLDNIVLMAIRKEPARRYASVELFSEDIRRHLSGLPVIAHRDTPGYRIGKFAQRHRAGVAAGVLLTMSLAAGLLGTAWQAHVAQLERQRAERRFNDVRRLANSFLFEFHDAIQNIPGTLAARQLILKRALEYLDSLAGEAGDDRALKSELAAAYDRVGTLTWDVAASLAAHRKALTINESLVRSEPVNRKYREQLADSYASVGDALRDANDSAGSLESHRQSMLIRRSLFESNPGNPEYQTLLADTYERLGIILQQTGRTGDALAWHLKASPLLQAALKAAPSNIDNRRAAMNNHLFIARVQEDQGDFKAALDNCSVARETAAALNADDPSNVTYRRDLWVNDLRVAGLLSKMGDSNAALAKYQSALSYIEKLSNADPGDKGHRRGLAVTYLAIGDTLRDLNKSAPAVASYNKAIAISQALLAADPNKGETMLDLANMHAHLGLLQHNADSMAKAKTLFDEALRRDPDNARIRREQAAALATMR